MQMLQMKVIIQLMDDNDCDLFAIANTFGLYCGRYPCSIYCLQSETSAAASGSMLVLMVVDSISIEEIEGNQINTANLLSTHYSAVLPGVVPLKMPELFIFKEIHMHWY